MKRQVLLAGIVLGVGCIGVYKIEARPGPKAARMVRYEKPTASGQSLGKAALQQFLNQSYVELTVSPHPLAQGSDRALQEQFAHQITQAAMLVPQRVAHFQKNLIPGQRHVGWLGTFDQVKDIGNGQFQVGMNVIPSLIRTIPPSRAVVADPLVETYLLDGNTVHLLDVRLHPNARPGYLH